MLHEQTVHVHVLKSHGLYMNCLAPNHFVKQCKSVQRCKRCQKLHYTLLHVNATPLSSTPALANPITLTEEEPSTKTQPTLPNPNVPCFTPVVSHFVLSNLATQLKSHTLMMTCRVLVSTPDNVSVEARSLLN